MILVILINCPNFVKKWVPKVTVAQENADSMDPTPAVKDNQSSCSKDGAIHPPHTHIPSSSATPSAATSSTMKDKPFSPVGNISKSTHSTRKATVGTSSSSNLHSKTPASKASNPFSVLDSVLDDTNLQRPSASPAPSKENVVPGGLDCNGEKIVQPQEPPVSRKRTQSKKRGANGTKN